MAEERRVGASLRFKLTALVLILSAFFILLEYTARKLYEPSRNLYARMCPEFGRLGSRLLVEDRRLIWRLRPGACVEHPVTKRKMHVNAEGFRGPAPPEEKPAGGLRVVFLGSSLFFGLGLSDPETVPARLAEALRKEFPGRTVEVFNLAVPGYSSHQNRLLAEEVLPALRPDVVVLGAGFSDALLSNYTDAEVTAAYPKPNRIFSFLDRLLGGLRIYELLCNRYRYKDVRRMLTRTLFAKDENVRVTARVPPRELRSDVEAILRTVKRGGARAILVDANPVNFYAADLLRRTARKLGANFLSVRKFLEDASGLMEYERADTHRLKRTLALQVRDIPGREDGKPARPFLLEVPLGRVRHPPLAERLPLRDDGTGLDRAPGDGIYTARLVDRGRRDFEFAPAMKVLIERAGAYEQFVETAVFYRLPDPKTLKEKGLYYSPVIGFSDPPFAAFLMDFNKSLLNAAGARRVAAVLAKRTAALLGRGPIPPSAADPRH